MDMAQDPAHFTIQMAAMSSEDGVERYLQKYALRGDVGIYLRSSGSTTMFVIVYGSYSDKASAQQAVDNLPETIQQQQLWIRPFVDIQAIIQSR